MKKGGKFVVMIKPWTVEWAKMSFWQVWWFDARKMCMVPCNCDGCAVAVVGDCLYQYLTYFEKKNAKHIFVVMMKPELS